MGESISEGTVAAVLKQPGDTVEEDEPILQIETDKVTIDVRSPERGKLENLLVKTDDTVTTGQLVATFLPGEEGSSSQSQAKDSGKDSGEKKNSKDQQKAAEPAPESESHAEEAPSHTGRRPSISFPRRRLPDGTRISDLPEEEQKKHLQQHQDAPQQSQASQQGGSQQKPQSPPPRKPAPWYVGKEQGTKLSQSRVLSEREMESIELGGA
ncbi:hypothetical protein WJX73_006301 [Symbiochloris irregularis]|uniref:Lipoyl-binding domain-containing protein n=1 Tax=Symbiochloris irregularis TaxID=706552 RepID=A0AAW1PFH9_9CHLO